MKKLFSKLGIYSMSLVVLGTMTIPTTIYASTIESQQLAENDAVVITGEEERALNQLASLSIEQLIDILRQEGYNPSEIFSEKEIQQAKLEEIRSARAGVNKIFRVNNETRDVYINSYIAITLKYVGFTAVGRYLAGWTGIAVGAVGANVNAGKGVIVRYNKQPGWKWGVNGYVWAIISWRSQ